MITAKDYFEQYLSWQRATSNLRSAASSYETYSTMELSALQPEAEAGNPGAQEELGERYLFGLSELHQDTAKAQALFSQAAQAGHPDAAHMLAEVHRTNEFGAFDYDQYFPLLQKAAAAGSWKAMFNLSCAYYKGRDAYEGHGFPVDKVAALAWSTRCSIMTMELLEFYFTHNCSQDFTDYMQGVYALFVQSVCVTARQLIRGDGVQKDVDYARTLLTQSEDFYQHYLKQSCPDFTTLLSHCE